MSVVEQLQPDFLELVGKPAKDIKLVFIANGADPYPEKRRGFVERDQNMLHAMGLTMYGLDLRIFNRCDTRPEDMYEALKDYDVIWVGGGNTFYLRYLLRMSCFDKVIAQLLEEGKVYGGGSAGAIVAGPTLECFEMADKPSRAKKVIMEGMNLTDKVIIPHWDHPMYGPIDIKIKALLDDKGFRTIPLTDSQAVVINGQLTRIIG